MVINESANESNNRKLLLPWVVERRRRPPILSRVVHFQGKSVRHWWALLACWRSRPRPTRGRQCLWWNIGQGVDTRRHSHLMVWVTMTEPSRQHLDVIVDLVTKFDDIVSKVFSMQPMRSMKNSQVCLRRRLRIESSPRSTPKDDMSARVSNYSWYCSTGRVSAVARRPYSYLLVSQSTWLIDWSNLARKSLMSKYSNERNAYRSIVQQLCDFELVLIYYWNYSVISVSNLIQLLSSRWVMILKVQKIRMSKLDEFFTRHLREEKNVNFRHNLSYFSHIHNVEKKINELFTNLSEVWMSFFRAHFSWEAKTIIIQTRQWTRTCGFETC